MQAIESSNGFSLIEVTIASAILGCAVLSVAQLVATSTSATRSARNVSEATFLAWQKIDELRSFAHTFDDAGAPITDASLRASPAGTLDRDTAGYVDIAAGTSYRRRWAIDSTAADVLLLRVRVLAAGREEELAGVATLKSRRRP